MGGEITRYLKEGFVRARHKTSNFNIFHRKE